MKNFQRNGAISNTDVGRDFEAKARAFFAKQGITLQSSISVPIGIEGKTKPHAFDLGDLDQKVIVECKSHTWTESENVPSAKITTWDQAMFFFHAAPKDLRKVFFVLKHYSAKRGATLADYYLRTKEHLIPSEVEFWEYDERTSEAVRKR